MNFPAFRSLILALMIGSAAPAEGLERLEPASGCYIGMLISDEDTIPRVSSRLGLTPAAVSRFYGFPFTASMRQSVVAFLDEVRNHGGIAVLTIEPFGGLSAITTAQCDDLGDLCAQQEFLGIGGIMIRFAHEMNGNWYAWGQQPALYRQKFQLLAASIHSRTTRTAMVWSPNNGIGYPFGTGTYSPAPGSANYLELDTNHDGVLTQADDMFGPFYPGDSAVDWVGITIYHWGVNYPWRENEPPVPGEFASVMNASGPGAPADYSRWFYPRFCSDGTHNKPLMIAETSAFYNTEQPGANELAMKQAWFRQLYNISGAGTDGADVAVTFPKMKCVNWFDHYKREGEAQNQFIDWRASANPTVRNAFVGAVRTLRAGQPYFLTAQEFLSSQSANGLIPSDVPAILPLSGNVTAVLKVKAQSACDLEIDLLDQNFVFKGGTRMPVVAGASTVSATFALSQTLIDGAQYRWSIFLTPTGGTYVNTLARHIGPDPVARTVAPFAAIESAPPSVPSGAAFVVRVKYVAPTDSALTLSLLNASRDVRGSGSAIVNRGDGVLDIAVTQLPANPPGAYTLQCAIGGRIAELPIAISNLPSADSSTLTVEPSVVSVGDVLRFVVGYAATTARDLRLELSNSAGAIIVSAIQPVLLGSKSIEMTISSTLATPGDYTAKVYVVPIGGTSAQAVASSAVQPMQVVSPGYLQWVLSRWGVILGNDPIGPRADPDGDGMVNSGEYVALTDPRNPTSVLRTSLSRSGSQFTVSWPSAIGRNYQLFSRANISSASWIPASTVLTGSGGMMGLNVDLNTSGVTQFYRVQVTLP